MLVIEIASAERFNISMLRPSRPNVLLFGRNNICLKTKSSLTVGIYHRGKLRIAHL